MPAKQSRVIKNLFHPMSIKLRNLKNFVIYEYFKNLNRTDLRFLYTNQFTSYKSMSYLKIISRKIFLPAI